MECSSCTTTLETFLKLSLRLCAAPRADRTCSVLNKSGWKRFQRGAGVGRLVTGISKPDEDLLGVLAKLRTAIPGIKRILFSTGVTVCHNQ